MADAVSKKKMRCIEINESKRKIGSNVKPEVAMIP